MRYTTAILPGFVPVLRRASAVRQATEKVRNAAEAESLGELQSSFGHFFGDRLSSPAVAGPIKRRKRLFTPEVTFWGFLSQVLTPGASCRQAVRRVQMWWEQRDDSRTPSQDCSAYCQARARLDQLWIEELNRTLTQRLSKQRTAEQLWCGRPVKSLDGSSASMPDTPANQERWPQSRNQKLGCGFPVMRMVGLFCLGTGAWIKAVHGTLNQAETRLAQELWPAMEKGDVLLGDRGFCSFVTMARMLRQGADCVFRLPKSRKLDLENARKLGEGDWVVTWKRPSPSGMEIEKDREEHASFPAEMEVRVIHFRVEVRGFRPKEIWLATTLLDSKKYPLKKLLELYLRRWGVEVYLREIKTFLGMEVLRCKKPQMIEREVLLHQIAYNLVRCIMQEAALIHHVALPRLSFKGTLDTMRTWAEAMHASRHCPSQQKHLFASMLAIIAKDTLPERPHRFEPRARKRRQKAYRLLTKPRKEMVIHPRPQRP